MQVSVESGNGLERIITVQVPEDRVDTEVDNRLKSMGSKVKIDGFRQGKVPPDVVKQHYGVQVRGEVVSELIQTSLQEALAQESLRPAGTPIVEPTNTEEGQPIIFKAKFEIIPVVSLAPFDGFKVEEIEVSVTDSDIDNMIETLRLQSATWKRVERASVIKDRVTVSFKGLMNGNEFEGGNGENVPVVLGSGAMIPGFEEKLVGVNADSKTSFETSFPDTYHVADLAGKAVTFEVSVISVEEPVMADVDDEFAKKYGVTKGGVVGLKNAIRNNLERELKNRVISDRKNAVMDRLLEVNDISAPVSLIKQEAAAIAAQASDIGATNIQSSEDALFIAERRIKLGLLLEEVVKQAGLVLEPAQVRKRIEEMSVDYEDPDEFVRHYYSDQKLLAGVETMVIEDATVDWIVEQSTVTTISRSFDEVMANKRA